MTAAQHAHQGRRLLAMALVAETPLRYERMLKLSVDAQQEAGIVLREDDPEVLALAEAFRAEDEQEWDALNPGLERSEDRCPRRE